MITRPKYRVVSVQDDQVSSGFERGRVVMVGHAIRRIKAMTSKDIYVDKLGI